jgi:hypothetical protein
VKMNKISERKHSIFVLKRLAELIEYDMVNEVEFGFSRYDLDTIDGILDIICKHVRLAYKIERTYD